MSAELRAKIAEQRAYIDLLVKAGKGSEDYAERVLTGVRAEIARTDSDLSLAYRLEEFLATVGDPQPTKETYTREQLLKAAAEIHWGGPIATVAAACDWIDWIDKQKGNEDAN